MPAPSTLTGDEEALAAELLTVEGARAAYDLAERELWDEYAEDPTYLNGKVYLAGEQLLRRRCDRDVQRVRYQREAKKAAS